MAAEGETVAVSVTFDPTVGVVVETVSVVVVLVLVELVVVPEVVPHPAMINRKSTANTTVPNRRASLSCIGSPLLHQPSELGPFSNP